MSAHQEVRVAPADMPIPDRLNLAIVALVLTVATGLLWWGSRVESAYAVLAVGVAFSYVMLTDYALLHEAAHRNLNSNRTVNRVLGTLLGFYFPCPYSLIRAAHQGHHLRNRTDHEMFDLYYPTESRILRYVQWYGILCGFFWPWVPLGALLLTVCPAALRLKWFSQSRSSNYLLNDIRNADVTSIRLEVMATLLYFVLLFWLLDLRWQNTLVLYACFAINWSTRQYVGHAFTKREIIDGAWNLRHNRLMSLLLLHSEWDLNHHRHPEIPWLYLPRLGSPPEAERSYWRQYLLQWTGPRLATEPAPEFEKPVASSIFSRSESG